MESLIHQQDREKMVEQQIQRRGITNSLVLAAMRKVPRHLFVPVSKQSMAYSDHPLGIDEGQTISQPYIVAAMTEQILHSANKKVLEIGTGSGYQTAVLAEIFDDVYSIERFSSLSKSAEQNLRSYENVHLVVADGNYGLPHKAPYDAIIQTCASFGIPQNLLEQLSVDGNYCFPQGDSYGGQSLYVLHKNSDGDFTKERLMGVVFVPMLEGVA
ncbi:MAG: protein-L-isoaspartate(D-aspartate) O-methyltransferase [Lentisphaeraceae bacterium]|nr:protein-L-isoaspartate(D-aspartate) O-methyltransferase [Lentisphaeraceae bacterium]